MFVTLIAMTLALTVQQDETVQPETQTTAPVLRLDAPQTSSAPDMRNDIVLRSAGEYAGYHRTLGDIRTRPLTSGSDLDRAMDNLSAYLGDERLVQAWLAYASLIAEQHPEFLDDVRDVADYYGRDAAIAGFLNDPAYATAFRNSDAASVSVLEVIDEDSSEIREVGEQFRIAAYDLQSARWANAVSRDRQARLSAIQLAGQRALPPGLDLFSTQFVDGGNDLGAASSEFSGLTQPTLSPSRSAPELALEVGVAYEPDRVRIGRILSIAALRAISDESSYSDGAITQLLADPLAQRCLVWARINLEQCVAAGHFKYEDSFCIAQHALLDVSDCLQAAQARQD